jgi:uncharacterized protein (TIGR01244 family)
MINEQKISDKVTAGGVPDNTDIDNFKNRGVATVINLLTEGEHGFTEGPNVEAAGLNYVSIPISVDLICDEAIERFSEAVEQSEGEVVVHCKSGGRAGIMALLHEAKKNGWDFETACEEGKKFNAKIGPESLYRPFFEEYISRKSNN